jgi:hypothetical protein
MAVVAVAVGVLACAGAAVAASKVEPGSYSGTLAAPRTEIKIKFKVSSNGKQVTALTISNAPLYCAGGGAPRSTRFANATISKSGTFTSTGKYVIIEGPFKGQVASRLKITGTFLGGGRERGMLTTKLLKAPADCSGTSSYSTTKG